MGASSIRCLVIDGIVEGFEGKIAREALEELEDDDLDAAVTYLRGVCDYLPASILRLLPIPPPLRLPREPDGGEKDILLEEWTQDGESTTLRKR